MASSEGLFSVSVVSILEEMLKEQGKRLCDMDLASRRADEAGEKILSQYLEALELCSRFDGWDWSDSSGYLIERDGIWLFLCS